MKLALALAVILGGCENRKQAPPPIPREASTLDAAYAWPSPPAPTLPPELGGLAWPISIDDVRAKLPGLLGDDGVPASGTRAFALESPSWYPRIWLRSELNLMTLEAAWGRMTRDQFTYPTWFNAAAGIRAKFDIKHTKPSMGVGMTLSSYVSTLDRVANAPEAMVPDRGPLLGEPERALDAYAPFIRTRDTLSAVLALPPGEWDPVDVTVELSIDKGSIWRLRFTVYADAPPVDESAVRAKLADKYGPATDNKYAKGKVIVRKVEPFRGIEITYLAP